MDALASNSASNEKMVQLNCRQECPKVAYFCYFCMIKIFSTQRSRHEFTKTF